MPLDLTTPISYLVTDGRTTEATNSSSAEFTRLFVLVGACVEARVSLVRVLHRPPDPMLRKLHQKTHLSHTTHKQKSQTKPEKREKLQL